MRRSGTSRRHMRSYIANHHVSELARFFFLQRASLRDLSNSAHWWCAIGFVSHEHERDSLSVAKYALETGDQLRGKLIGV